jgi:hypothetical protein
MNRLSLPDPTTVVSAQRDPSMSVFLDSYRSSIIQAPNVPGFTQLAPMHFRVPERGIDFPADLRRPSTPSIESSRQTLFTPRLASSVFSHSGLEPSYENTAPPNHLQMEKHHIESSPYYKPTRSEIPCPCCLQNSQTVWVASGKKCHRCNTPVHDGVVFSRVHTTGKMSKKKRVDRKKHSHMNVRNHIPSTRVTKRDGEAGRRYDHAYALSMLQHTLLGTNPSLVKTAAANFGNSRCGWSPLKNNNICWDVKKYEGIDPLLYNKMDILHTSRLIHEQSNAMIDDILNELLSDFQAKALARCNPYFARKLTGLTNRIAKARETRGEDDWLSPAQLLAEKPDNHNSSTTLSPSLLQQHC